MNNNALSCWPPWSFYTDVTPYPTCLHAEISGFTAALLARGKNSSIAPSFEQDLRRGERTTIVDTSEKHRPALRPREMREAMD